MTTIKRRRIFFYYFLLSLSSSPSSPSHCANAASRNARDSALSCNDLKTMTTNTIHDNRLATQHNSPQQHSQNDHHNTHISTVDHRTTYTNKHRVIKYNQTSLLFCSPAVHQPYAAVGAQPLFKLDHSCTQRRALQHNTSTSFL